jgi:hypothetical protein
VASRKLLGKDLYLEGDGVIWDEGSDRDLRALDQVLVQRFCCKGARRIKCLG